MVDTNASCKPSSARNGAYGRGEAKRVDGFLNGLRTKKTESSFLGGFKNGSKENRSGKLAHQVFGLAFGWPNGRRVLKRLVPRKISSGQRSGFGIDTVRGVIYSPMSRQPIKSLSGRLMKQKRQTTNTRQTAGDDDGQKKATPQLANSFCAKNDEKVLTDYKGKIQKDCPLFFYKKF